MKTQPAHSFDTTHSRDTRSPSGEPLVPAGRANPLAHIMLNGILVVLFGYFFLQARELPSSMWEPLGSGSFPRLVLGLLMLINLAIIAKELRNLKGRSPGAKGQTAAWIWRHRLAFAVLGLLAVFILALPWLGFAVASFLFIMLGQWLLGARSLRQICIAVVIAVVFSFGADALFRDVFVISLPRGLLG
ncbi:tripartite tricarboxylate transporter TctB family protein [Halomonas binhaiensis]|uniref:Tripartite tricarboxylate transporter TctB family protein n=1 Tax=Halomonas binhaiensis TaxID=2562282 RepID=A0A5C1NF22_9GAMM|nr:tripartite tricarboxylate transporter TctB family protein [Halomonas binhaiensis]QEM81223.1 tripartite tricarboxylate transporter TctB family protein [Halomonas binhaiensis]